MRAPGAAAATAVAVLSLMTIPAAPGAPIYSLPQPARLALPLQQHEDVALPDRTLDVPHDRARRVVEELHAHLDDRAGLASAAEHLGDLSELDGLIHRAAL